MSDDKKPPKCRDDGKHPDACPCEVCYDRDARYDQEESDRNDRKF